MQGSLQRSLRVAASLTMGLIDILRIRVDGIDDLRGNEEVIQLRELIASLKSEQEKTGAEISAIRKEMVQAKAIAEADQKTEMVTCKILSARTMSLSRSLERRDGRWKCSELR